MIFRDAKLGRIARLTLLVLCFVGLTLGTANAQIPAELRGQRVLAVEVAGTTSGFYSGRDVGIPLGAVLSRRLLRGTVERLIASGRFRDVQLDLVPEAGGVRVVAHLVPRVLLARVEVRGNELIDDTEIARLMGLSEGSEFRQEDIDEVATEVENAYWEQGYESARLNMVLRETDDPTRQVLIVEVQEGRPTPIAMVVFEGEHPPEISHGVSTLDLDRGDPLNRRTIDERARDASQVMRERGFLEANLGEPEYRRTDHGTEVVFRSQVGPRYEVAIRGHEPLMRTDVEEVLELRESPIDEDAMEGVAERV